MRSAAIILTGFACAFFSTTSCTEEPQPIIRVGSKPAEVILAKITVSNLRESYDFYTNVIGLKEIRWPGLPEPVFDKPDVQFTEVSLNFSGSAADPFLVLVKQKGLVPAEEHARLTWVGVKITDARAAVNRAKAAGLRVEVEAKLTPRGLVFGLIRDPDGYLVQLLEAQSAGQ